MATSIQAIITQVCSRLGVSSAPASNRARGLEFANEGERLISQPGSFLYLSKRYPLILNNNAESIAMPTSPAVDYGKSMSLRIVGEKGYLTYYPHDRFMTGAVSSFYALRNNQPACWTFARDAAQVMTIFLNPKNTTGGNLSLELTAQMTVAALVDTPASFSLLPEGYELTLLAKYMEAEWGRVLSRPGAARVREEFDELLEIFYAAQRTSKEHAGTDTEASQRKQADVELHPEA